MIGAMDSEHAAPFIDPRTIVFFSGIMGGLMVVVLAFLRRGEEFVVLLARADAAMYRAREMGRNQVVLG